MSSLPHKVPLTVKLKASSRRELERLARRSGDGPSTFAAKLLEAAAAGLVFCTACGHAHAVQHLGDE